MRTRKRGSASNGKVIKYDGGAVEGTVVTRMSDSDEAVIVDTKHPDWLVSKGKKIVLGDVYIDRMNLSTTIGTAVFPPISNNGVTWTGRSYVGQICLANMGDSDITPSWYLNDVLTAELSVVNKAFAKAYGSTATVLVTAAEMHKTIGMVQRPFGKARDLLGLMTRRYRSLLSRGLKAAEAAAQAWLEYRLGWKPVLYDLENIAKAVKEQLTTVDFTHLATYRSSANLEWGGFREETSGVLSPASSRTGHIKKVRHKVTAGVILTENLYDESSNPYQRIFGMQLHDVAPAVWELIPYSFVVDRFLEVQTWLKAIQPRPNTSVAGSWQTTVRHAESEYRTLEMSMTVTVSGKTFYPKAYPSDISTGSRFTMNRRVGVGPSVVPVLNTSALNLNQHLDHAALILGQIVGLFPETKSRSFGRTKRS